VILLTAKVSIQARLEGLDLGADAYIDKPFSMDMLLIQISNLLKNRENIRKFYFTSPVANMKSMAYSKADKDFLEKLNTIIDENLHEASFEVNTIATMLCMSRSTLYRKIMAISNLTPNDLIRTARLKKAAKLLLQSKKKIYEISEEVGFNSQSYFWSAFIKQFGISPTKFVKTNKK
jgi:AraC-like DNA-binding protein